MKLSINIPFFQHLIYSYSMPKFKDMVFTPSLLFMVVRFLLIYIMFSLKLTKLFFSFTKKKKKHDIKK